MSCIPGVALMAAAFLMVEAQAQTAPSGSVPGKNAPVVSDVAPPPPEDRSSTGAIRLEQSPVRAQRERQEGSRGGPDARATQTQGAGPLVPESKVQEVLRGTGLEEPPAKPR